MSVFALDEGVDPGLPVIELLVATTGLFVLYCRILARRVVSECNCFAKGCHLDCFFDWRACLLRADKHFKFFYSFKYS